MGNSVETIATEAFYHCENLTNFDMPSSVTTIGDQAFMWCESLEDGFIGEGVTTIGASAFKYCYFTSITIPNSVTSIGAEAFDGSNLTRIFAQMENPCEIPEDLFDSYYCESIPLYVPAGTKEKYEQTNYWNKFVKIEEGEFKEMAADDGSMFYFILNSNALTAKVTYKEIPEREYDEDDDEGEVKRYAHARRSAAIKKPTGMRKITPAEAYVGSLTIPETISVDGKTYTVTGIGESAFENCSELTGIVIPNTVTSIEDEAFSCCTNLTSIDLPSNITSIGDWAFGMSAVTKMTIPASVTSIGYNPFYNCDDLTSLTVENGNTTYDSRYNCNAIVETATDKIIAACSSTTIPNDVTTIGVDAFGGLSNITELDLHKNVTTIEPYAFEYCDGLTTIDLPKNLTTIEEAVFYGCSSLTAAAIPEGVTTIGDYAFSECYGLTTLILPSTLTSIGEYCFDSSYDLQEVHCQMKSPFAIDKWTFDSDTYENATLYVPSGTKEKYQSTASWNLFTNIVEEEVTAVDRILLGQQGSITVYDTKGRKINPSQMRKGHVYIVNGKKTVVR